MDLFPNARIAAGFRHNMPSFGESATVWNVSGRWDITPNLFVRGSVGTAFRLPSAEELFALRSARQSQLDRQSRPGAGGEHELQCGHWRFVRHGEHVQLGNRWFLARRRQSHRRRSLTRSRKPTRSTTFRAPSKSAAWSSSPASTSARSSQDALSYPFNSSEVDGEQIERVPEQHRQFHDRLSPDEYVLRSDGSRPAMSATCTGTSSASSAGTTATTSSSTSAGASSSIRSATTVSISTSHNVFDEDYVTIGGRLIHGSAAIRSSSTIAVCRGHSCSVTPTRSSERWLAGGGRGRFSPAVSFSGSVTSASPAETVTPRACPAARQVSPHEKSQNGVK